MMRMKVLAPGAALAAAAIWGFAFVVVKDSLSSIGPLWMMAVRFSIAAAALALLFLLQYTGCRVAQRAVSRRPLVTRAHLVHGAVLGALLFAGYVLQTVGCIYTTAGKNAFLTAAYVVLVPILGWALHGARPNVNVFAAAVIALAGIAMLSLGGGDAGGNVRVAECAEGVYRGNRGDVLTLACAVFFALHIIYMERVSKQCSVTDVMINSTLQFAAAALLSAAAAPLADGPLPLAALGTSRVLMSMLYLGVLSTMAGFVLQNIALKYAPPAVATILLSMESAFAALFSVLCLGERFTCQMAAGSALIFCAVVLAQVKAARKKERA